MSKSSRWLHVSSSFFRSGLICLVCLLFLGTFSLAYALPYQLTVNKGSGGGQFEPSSLVHISAFPYDTSDPAVSTIEPADPAAPVRIFDRWIGDTASLSDVLAKDTTLVMPANNITITAQFKDVPRWELPRLMVYFPENPVGVIYLFHGLGGGLAPLLSSLEAGRFVDQANSRNFAVVMIESYDRKDGLWDVTHPDAADNLDMQRLAAVHSQLVSKGKILPEYPIYCAGISYGGVFATMVAEQAGQGALPFTVRAMAAYISSGNREALQTSLAPTIFVLAQNDSTINSAALANFDLLISRNIASQIWLQAPTPVHPNKFWGIQGLSQTDSQFLQGQLKASGMLDAQDFILPSAFEDLNGDFIPDWMAAIPSEYDIFLSEISNQLTIAYTGHAFFSNLNEKTFDFFENPTTIISSPPEITGFSPASGPVGTVVTVTGNNFVDIQSVTFNGTPASIVVSLPTTLTVVVPVGATTGPIRVTNSAGTAVSPGEFTVTGTPVITGFTPSTGGVGQWVTVTGENFVQISAVSFNGVPAVFQAVSQTSLYAQVPAGATTGPVMVTNWLGTAVSGTAFTIVNAPSISGFTPAWGPVGTVVTINGSNFASTTAVKFGQVSASFVVVSDSVVKATVPAGASSSKITVTNPGGYATSATRFYVR